VVPDESVNALVLYLKYTHAPPRGDVPAVVDKIKMHVRWNSFDR
jgi:hypothetical protein